jgi:hypothetical protein
LRRRIDRSVSPPALAERPGRVPTHRRVYPGSTNGCVSFSKTLCGVLSNRTSKKGKLRRRDAFRYRHLDTAGLGGPAKIEGAFRYPDALARGRGLAVWSEDCAFAHPICWVCILFGPGAGLDADLCEAYSLCREGWDGPVRGTSTVISKNRVCQRENLHLFLVKRLFLSEERLFSWVENHFPSAERLFSSAEHHLPLSERLFSSAEHHFPLAERLFLLAEHHFPLAEHLFSLAERLFPSAERLFLLEGHLFQLAERPFVLAERLFQYVERPFSLAKRLSLLTRHLLLLKERRLLLSEHPPSKPEPVLVE